jgi:hypothetical protein
MKFATRSFALAVTGCLTLALSGCDSSTKSPPKAEEHSHEHEGHEGHDHAAAGPHGGHIVEIGKEEYHAEWTHDDSGKVTVYVLDAAMKKDVPVDGETIKIAVKLGDNAKEYTLDAEGPMASKFSIEDKTLVGNLEALSDAVTATLSLDIGGKHYDAPITAGGHDHEHDHDHKH